MLIVLTGAFSFQTLCMLVKYKSLTDASDKKSALPEDTYIKKPDTKKGFSFKENKYVEKPNYDIPDDDDDSVGMMVFYLFI